MHKTVKLTESDLHKIVKESVNRIINEWFDSDGDWHRDFGDDAEYGEPFYDDDTYPSRKKKK